MIGVLKEAAKGAAKGAAIEVVVSVVALPAVAGAVRRLDVAGVITLLAKTIVGTVTTTEETVIALAALTVTGR